MTAGMTIVLATPLVLPVLPPDQRWTYSDTCTTVPFLLLALGTFRWRLADAGAEERRFWNLMSVAIVCWLGQQAVLIGTYAPPLTVSFGLVQELFYVGLYLFMILALDVRPHLRPERDEGGRLAALRRAGAVLFVFGALGYFVLVPTALDPDSYWAGVPSFTFYLVLDGYLVLRLMGALAEAVERRWRLVYGWLLATSASWLVLDLVEALMWTEVLPWVGAGTPLDLPWMVPLVTLTLAGRARAWAGGEDGEPLSDERARPRGDHSLGSPLILLAMLVPLLHFTAYGLDLFDESMRHAHELLAFGLFLVLGGLVFAYQSTLEVRNRRLERERQAALARVEYQAYHDPLTTLPNRRLLEDRVGQAMAHADRRGMRVAILFFDLDGFKSVNDSSGHAVGDDLLRRIGQRLAARVRASDTLARLGGDEFVVMATDVTTRDAATRLATDVQESLHRPFEVDGVEHRVSASVGVSLYPDDGDTLSTLLQQADRAMYAAKEKDSRSPRQYPSGTGSSDAGE